jgi:AraC-like DNA-binding protein
MVREQTISAGVVRALLELATSRGAERQALCDAAHIAPGELTDADNRIPFGRFVALMRAAKTLTNDPALGLHFGEAFDVAELSVGCVASGMSATTMEGVVTQINRFSRLGADLECEGDGDRMRLSRTRSAVWLVDARKNPNLFPEYTESTFARLVTSTRRITGTLPLFTAVEFSHPQPAYADEYDRIFQVPVRFGCERNAIGIDQPLFAAIRPPVQSPLVKKVLIEHAQGLLKRLEEHGTVRAQVEALLAPQLERDGGRVESIAHAMALSRQTLFRKLKAEGVTFAQLRDDLRYRMALSYMEGEESSVKRTARLLGFKEPSSFSRAFKRWTGSSPRMQRHT